MVKWGHILISDAILSLLLSVNSQALTNVALHKPTQQSTYHPGFGKPENVVDGNSDTHLDYCTHTADRDQNPTRWWMVDLRAFYTVHTVLITNRGDCCGFRLSDFDVEVSTQNLARVAMTSQNTQLCYHHAGSVADGATVQVDCSQPIRGRYVRVVLHTSVEPLNICEVQVLATSVAPAFILTHNFVRTKAHKAPGDVIQQVYVTSVTQCITTCEKDPACTDVNLARAMTVTSQGLKRACQLLSFGGISQTDVTDPNADWDFYQRS